MAKMASTFFTNYDDLGQVTVEKKYWSSETPVALPNADMFNGLDAFISIKAGISKHPNELQQRIRIFDQCQLVFEIVNDEHIGRFIKSSI